LEEIARDEMNTRFTRLTPFHSIGLTTLALLGCVGVWLLFRFDPASHGFYPVCFLHQATGLQCPGCGSLRAIHQLLHGHVAAAWRLNPLLVSALPLLGWFATRFALAKCKGQAFSWNIRPVWLWSAMTLVVGFGIVRNLPLGW
jgi:Protein of unknown function (DUF2752)